MSLVKDDGAVLNASVEKDTEDGDVGQSFVEGFRKSVDADRPEEDIARSGHECDPDVTIDAKKYGEEQNENATEKSSPETAKVGDTLPLYANGCESNMTPKDRGCSNDNSETEETRDKTEFVQVDSESIKVSSPDMSDIQDESMESGNATDEDPIGGTENVYFDDGEPITDDRVAGTDIDPLEGSGEEVYIIPDTEREISQAEKDAAMALMLNGKEKESEESSNENLSGSAKKNSDSSKAAVSSEAEDRKEEKMSTSVEGSDDHKSESGIRVTNVCSIGFGEQKESEDLMLHTLEVKTNKSCVQCCSVQLCRYQFSFDNKDSYICRGSCLTAYREAHPGTNIKISRIWSSQPRTGCTRSRVRIRKPFPFIRRCSKCKKKICDDERNLTWECMEYCNENCLAIYQNSIGSCCANCKNNVPSTSLGKYCVRFGSDIRQFCNNECLEEFKKGLKICSYCQKDISGDCEGFLVPVGDEGQFKDFCTRVCMKKYNKMSNNRGNVKEIGECDVCNIVKAIHTEVLIDDQCIKLCSEPCFVAYKFTNNLNPVRCDTCHRYYDKVKQKYAFHSDQTHRFCSETCRNVFIVANRKIVPCLRCKVKKYDNDMIKKTLNNGIIVMICSINCFALYQVSVNAISSREFKCDECGAMHLAQFHLMMPVGTIRNFCSYKCVMLFQNPITVASVTPEEPPTPLKTPDNPIGRAKRTYTRQTRNSTTNVEQNRTVHDKSYSIDDYVDMILVYGECLCRASEAAREYALRFPNRRHPDAHVIERTERRMRERNCVLPVHEGGRLRSAQGTFKAEIRQQLEEDPTTSCRAIAAAIGISKSSVNRILLAESFRPLHRMKVQELHEGDRQLRVQFCRQLLQAHAGDPDFLKRILWTGECLFTREGCFNQHNSNNNALENPEDEDFQRTWELNIWGGIVGNHVFIYNLPEVMSGNNYYVFLEEVLPEILEDVPLTETVKWFQHNGTPSHDAAAVTELLNRRFPGRWYGRNGPLRWPPRSPDLTPLDFFFWRYLKSVVFFDRPEDEFVAVSRLHAAVADISVEMLERVRVEVIQRAQACLDADGGQF